MTACGIGLVVALSTGCGGAPPQPVPLCDVEDPLVGRLPRCECAVPRRLADSDAIGDLTVAEVRRGLSGTWRGALRWRPQPYLELPSAPTEVTVTVQALEAEEVACTEWSLENCRRGAAVRVLLTLQSGDGLLDTTIDTVLWPFPSSPGVFIPIPLPRALVTRRTGASAPPVWLSLLFDSEPPYDTTTPSMSLSFQMNKDGGTVYYPVADTELQALPK